MNQEQHEWYWKGYNDAKQALKQPEQEPVAWMIWIEGNAGMFSIKREAQIEFAKGNEKYPDEDRKLIPLYTHPPKRDWVGLTEYDRLCLKANNSSLYRVVYRKENDTDYMAENTNWSGLFRDIEAKLKEKNNE